MAKKNKKHGSNRKKNKAKITRIQSNHQDPPKTLPERLQKNVPEAEKEAEEPASLEATRLSLTKEKIAKLAVLYASWKVEDDSRDTLSAEELVSRQKQRCKDIGLIVFGFCLHEKQVEAVHTLFYERRDLLLLARTAFGKSLIFQLMPFMVAPTGVVIILMPLKLLQVEQNTLINRLPYGKAVTLTGENNQKSMQREIANGNYTHVFTSPEIVDLCWIWAFFFDNDDNCEERNGDLVKRALSGVVSMIN